jgi:hypothetical protein
MKIRQESDKKLKSVFVGKLSKLDKIRSKLVEAKKIEGHCKCQN